jgi:hypothetical protein
MNRRMNKYAMFTHGGEHQLEITSTRERAMGSTTQPTNGKSTF